LKTERKHKWFRLWLLDWMVLSLIGTAFSVSLYLTSSEPISWFEAFAWQFLRFQIWAAFAPVIIWLGRQARSEKRQVFRIIAVHFPSSVFLAVVHTAIFPLAYLLATNQPVGYDLWLKFYSVIVVSNFVMGSVVYWVVLTANYAIDYYSDFRAEQKRVEKLEAQLAQAELQALKMQLNPHFLFNTLNSISSLVLENPRAANRMIARLGDFLRLTLDNDSNQQITLERELEFLKNYLEIERIRFQDRLTINFAIKTNILNAQVPNLILQPLVENAIKHGIAPLAAKGRIEIRANRHGEKLRLQVQDTGRGLSANNGSGFHYSEGIGIANTNARLQQLYGDNFIFNLANADEGGLIVTVEFPFSSELNAE